MTNKYLPLLLLGLLALAQLYVPASMIRHREEVLASGKAFRFQSAPVDPSDPFRGKYISLQYKHNTIALPGGQNWESGDEVFVLLARDRAGFARIRQVDRKKPPPAADYVKARVAYVNQEQPKPILVIDYPFNRFYMEESKALAAEQAYAASLSDSSQVTYALVRIKAGEAVLEDVMIGEVSIREKRAASRQHR
jgi:uncharacterized membrane-anchored protein